MATVPEIERRCADIGLYGLLPGSCSSSMVGEAGLPPISARVTMVFGFGSTRNGSMTYDGQDSHGKARAGRHTDA